MKQETSRSKKTARIIWKTLGLLLLTFVLLVGILYFVAVSQGKNLLPELITRYAEEMYDVKPVFSGFEVNRAENFPFLTFNIHELHLEGSDCKGCKSDLLEIQKLSFKIDPWDLLRNFINLKDIRIEDAKIRFRKGENGHRKIDFLKGFDTDDAVKSKNKFKLDSFSLQNVLLEYQDDVKEKSFSVVFKNAKISTQKKERKTALQVDAKCFFNGLSFNLKNGYFLKEKVVDLLLNFEISKDSVLLDNSVLIADIDTLQLAGTLIRREIPYLDLHISTPAIKIEKAAPLLDDKLQKVLAPFKINRPLQVDFHLSGELKPKHRPAIEVDFRTTNADFIFNKTDVTNMTLHAEYSNHCRTVSEEIQRGEDCLTIHSVTGNFLDEHIIDLNGVIHDFKKMNLNMAGTAVLDLPALQPYLKKTPFELLAGKADVIIDYAGNFKPILDLKLLQKKGIYAAVTLRNTRLKYRGLLYKNLNGKLYLEAQKSRFKNLHFTHGNQNFVLTGQADNMLPYAFNGNRKLDIDLLLTAKKLNTKAFLPKSKNTDRNSNISSSLSTQFTDTFKPIVEVIDGNLRVAIQQISHKETIANNTSFSILFSEEKQDKSHNFLTISDLKTTLFDSLKIAANATFQDINNPKLFVDFSLNSSLFELNNLVKNSDLHLQSGTATFKGKTNLFLSDLEKISIEKLADINFQGELNLTNANIDLIKNKEQIKELSTGLIFDQNSLTISQLSGKIREIQLTSKGKIDNYFAYFVNKKAPTRADLKLNFGEIDLTNFASDKDTKTSFEAKSLLQSFAPTFDKISGKLDINIATLKFSKVPLTNLIFTLKAEQNNEKKTVLSAQNFSANIFGRSPLRADFKITDLNEPIAEAHFESNMPIQDLSDLLGNDNFQPKKGNISIVTDYKNSLQDSLNLQHYLLTADMNGQINFADTELFYAPRGLTFAQMNGRISFSEESLSVNFKDMIFNKNTVSVSGTSHDFLPFFFEENKDLTLDLNLTSPRVNFHNFDTPKTLKSQSENELADAQQQNVDNIIDRLLSEGNLSLRTKIDEVVYDNFLAKNVVGRAQINDNEVVLDTFRMLTSDGLFGVNSIISDIDKEKIQFDAEFTMSDIDASKVLKSFDNFGQTTLMNDNIIGIVDAQIDFSTTLNDNYEVFSETMVGLLDLRINKGAFINFSGLTNLDGFLYRKRRLHEVYFDTLETQILISGEDMEFKPTELNSTAATLTVDGLYTFSDKDRTNLVIEVPLGNVFKRYVAKAEIRKQHKKRKGLPIIVEVTEKDKVLDFDIRLRRSDENK